jgi:hypothetical protein
VELFQTNRRYLRRHQEAAGARLLDDVPQSAWSIVSVGARGELLRQPLMLILCARGSRVLFRLLLPPPALDLRVPVILQLLRPRPAPIRHCRPGDARTALSDAIRT